MKTIIVISATCLILLTACGSGSSTPPVTPAAPLPEISMAFSRDLNLAFGDSIAITCSVKNADFGVLTSKDTIIQVYNNATVKLQLFKTTTFTLSAKNADGKESSTSQTVTVGDYTTSMLGLINHNNKHWVTFLSEIIQNDVVYEVPLTPEEIGRYYVFSVDGSVNYYDKNNNLLNSAKWVIYENNTKIKFVSEHGTMYYLLDKLDENFLSITYQAELNGVPYSVRTTYKIEN